MQSATSSVKKLLEAINGATVLQPDVIGIDKIRTTPSKSLDGRIRLGTHGGGIAVDDQVFTIGFIPDRCDLDAHFFGSSESGQLCLSLAGKSVADAHAEFWKKEWVCHR